jgi:hypothetical protein
MDPAKPNAKPLTPEQYAAELKKVQELLRRDRPQKGRRKWNPLRWLFGS